MLIAEQHLQAGILVYIWTKYLWQQYLRSRQCIALQIHSVAPIELENPDENEYERKRTMTIYFEGIKSLKEGTDITLTTTLILFQGLRKLWDVSHEIVAYFGFTDSSGIFENAVFLTMMNSFHFLKTLPFITYEIIMADSQQEMQRITLTDIFLEHTLIQTLLFPIICLIFFLFKLRGNSTLLCIFFVTELEILWTFFVSDPSASLYRGELRTSLSAFLQDQGFPLHDIHVSNGYVCSNHHSRMYFRGKTGQKMLVLSEDIAGPNYLSTLDETLTTEEVVAIAAHELGHWKYCHYCINLVVNQLCLGLEMFSMFWLLKYQPLYTAFGFDDTPTSIGLTLLRYSCVTDMCRFFVRVVNRSTEFSADRHVKVLRKHRHLKSAMIKIEKNDGLFPVQDWLYSLCCNFQPTCYERIKAINNYIP